MSEWFDIESAPKDGTPVLMIDAHAQIPTTAIVHWGEYETGAFGFRLGLEWSWADLRRAREFLGWIDKPTHWMPLPAPPATPINAKDET